MKENHHEQIDRTLRALGSVTPDSGLEDRLLARIARDLVDRKEPRLVSLRQFAFGMSAAVIAGALIVVGSVSHSRHLLPVTPGLHLPVGTQPGIGAASAAHVAPQPVASLPHDRPRSIRKALNGRAAIARHASRPAGVAVPKTLPRQ